MASFLSEILKQGVAGQVLQQGMGALGQMLQNGKLSSMAGGVLSVIGMATSAMGLVNSVKNLRR